jgi:branched-chain amino acid transport system permease protein
LLIAIGPVVLAPLWLLLHRTRWGTLVRAATQDREMVGALGVNQAWLFTSVFALGALLAGLGGALQLPREPASLELDMHTIGAAFVVVVVGGMGSLPGAFVAALLIAELKALCIWIGLVEVGGVALSFSKLTLVVEFLVMAVVLVWRPWGLMGKPQAPARARAMPRPRCKAAGPAARTAWLALLAALVLLPMVGWGLALCHRAGGRCAGGGPFCRQPAFLHGACGHAFVWPRGLLRPGRLRRSAAGARGGPAHGSCFAAGAAGGGAGRAGVRLVLRAAVGRVAHHAHAGVCTDHLGRVLPVGQPDRRQQRHHRRVAFRLVGQGARFYWLTLTLVALGVLLLRRVLLAPLGYALRAGRDSPLRAEAIGMMCGVCSGSALCWRARWRAWRGAVCWPRAAFRPKPWPWPSRWMAW